MRETLAVGRALSRDGGEENHDHTRRAFWKKTIVIALCFIYYEVNSVRYIALGSTHTALQRAYAEPKGFFVCRGGMSRHAPFVAVAPVPWGNRKGGNMNVVEKIYEHVKALPESAVLEVLDFVEFIKMRQEKSADKKSTPRTERLRRMQNARGLWKDTRSAGFPGDTPRVGSCKG